MELKSESKQTTPASTSTFHCLSGTDSGTGPRGPCLLVSVSLCNALPVNVDWTVTCFTHYDMAKVAECSAGLHPFRN